MSHPEQRQFVAMVRDKYPTHFANVRVLEVGSLDINGSIRGMFTDCDYTGVDVGPGPGVDVVAHGEDLTYPARDFDTVLSLECFEHNPEWLATFVNMHRMCSGLVVMTCATTGRPEHGTRATTPADSPHTVGWDYYRNLTADDFTSALDLKSMFTTFEFMTNDVSHDLYFYGLVRTHGDS